MITMPYVNFAALSKERDNNHVEDNLPSTLYKNGDKITIKLKDGKVLSGTFNGYWGEDNDDGLFIDDYAISDSEIADIIRNDIDNQINEVLRLAGVQLNDGNQIMESLNESVISEQVPEKLYYATFSKLLRKIKKCGYLGNSPYKLWSDSNNKYVYLSTDPDKAYSYAETALDDCDNERLYDMLEDDDIVILEIDTKYLDKNKLFRDENVVDGETTYQYKGIINCQIMKIYKPTLDESVENAGIEQMNESVSSEFLGLIGLPIFTFLATIGIGVLCKNRYKTVQQLKDSCEVVGVSKLDDKLIVKCKSDLPSDKSLSYYAGEKHLSGSTTIPIRTGNITTFHNKKQYDKEYYVVVHYNNKNKEPTYIEFIPDGSWSKEKHKETIKLDDGKLKDKIESLLKEME